MYRSKENGSKILCENYEICENETIVIKNHCFSDLELPACSVVYSFPRRLHWKLASTRQNLTVAELVWGLENSVRFTIFSVR